MEIDPKVEKLTRTMLGHAVKGQFDELAQTVRGIDDRQYGESLALCIAIASYVVVDVLGPEWPTDTGIHEMARGAVRSENDIQLDETLVYNYLKKTALESQPWDQVFSSLQDAASWPIAITASVMLAYCPAERKLWGYLDDIEEALEAADSAKPSMLPAMIIRAHRIAWPPNA